VSEKDHCANVSSFVVLDERGAPVEYEGPFEFTRDGGSFEVSMPIGHDDDASIHRTAAAILRERVGDHAVTIADGGIEATGVIEGADILESTLVVRVNDGHYVSPSDVDDRSEEGDGS